jgi:hypothetical protein
MTVPPEAVTAAAQFIDDEYHHATQRHIPDWSRDLAIGALEAAAPLIAAAAAAAQREADAQLAEQHDAWARRWHPEPHANEWTDVPFADLLRNPPEGTP